MNNIDPALYTTYSEAQITTALNLLTYKKVSPLPKDENPAHPILYVFRHGQTTDNADFIFSGWRDADLTAQGVKQAEILAEKLKTKHFGLLIASDQIRAIKTMQIAMALNPTAKKLEILRDPRIKERSYGDLQGQSKLLLQLQNPALLHEYRRSYNVQPPNGESLAMVVDRVNAFLTELLPKMRDFNINVAVSCHGNSIRGIRKYFENLTEEQTAEIETPLAQDYAAYQIV